MPPTAEPATNAHAGGVPVVYVGGQEEEAQQRYLKIRAVAEQSSSTEVPSLHASARAAACAPTSSASTEVFATSATLPAAAVAAG